AACRCTAACVTPCTSATWSSPAGRCPRASPSPATATAPRPAASRVGRGTRPTAPLQRRGGSRPSTHPTRSLLLHQIREALAERLGAHARRLGQAGQAVRLGEIARVQADHVAPGALVALAVDVHPPRLHPARLGV